MTRQSTSYNDRPLDFISEDQKGEIKKNAYQYVATGIGN